MLSIIIQITLFVSLLCLVIAIQHIILRRSIKRDFDVAKSIFCLLSIYDHVMVGHSLHVLKLTELFYKYLPSEYKIKLPYYKIKYTTLLHDIGKLAIPKEVLYKPGKLTAEEKQLVKRHTDIGKNLIADDEALNFMVAGILYHHERIDGNGYKSLKEKDIPLEAKIIAIADTYSAIVMSNSFKPSRTYADAIIGLRMSASSQLDKNLVDIFCSIPQGKVNACLDEVRACMENYQKKLKTVN